jgi:hypothetical protein
MFCKRQKNTNSDENINYTQLILKEKDSPEFSKCFNLKSCIHNVCGRCLGLYITE